MAMDSLNIDCVVKLSRFYRFQYEQAQGCHVLLFPEGMIQLNGTASAILKLCDGKQTVAEIICTLKQAYAEVTGLERDVIEFLQDASRQKWIIFGDKT